MLIIILSALLLVIVILLLLAPKKRQPTQEAAAQPSITGPTVTVSPPNPLSLGISQSHFPLQTESTATVTVACNFPVSGPVRIQDSKGNVLTVLENDGSGYLTGEVTLYSDTSGCEQLTAHAENVSSMDTTVWFTPEITDDQLEVLVQVVCQLGQAVDNQDFADRNSAEAKSFVMEWLKNDPRVRSYTDHGDIILFTTVDSLVGGYCGTATEAGIIGPADATEATETTVTTAPSTSASTRTTDTSQLEKLYKDWCTSGSLSPTRTLYAGGAPTNSRILILSSNSDDIIENCHTLTNTLNSTLGNKLGLSVESYTKGSFIKYLENTDFTDCAVLALLAHGSFIERSTGTPMHLFALKDTFKLSEFSLTELAFKEGYYYYGDDEIPESNHSILLCGTSQKKFCTVIETMTSTGFLSRMGNNRFDNTIITFCSCYAAVDQECISQLLSRGASAVFGCTNELWVNFWTYDLVALNGTLCLPKTDTDNEKTYHSVGDYSKSFEGDDELRNTFITENPDYFTSCKTENEKISRFYALRNGHGVHAFVADGKQMLGGSKTFTCHVTDPKGEPVPQAKIRLLRWRDRSFTVEKEIFSTDEKGNCTIPELPYGAYIVEAEYMDATEEVGWFHLPEESGPAQVVLKLYSLSGTAVVEETGKPAKNASVTAVIGNHSFTCTADASGNYRFRHLPAGSCKVVGQYEELTCEYELTLNMDETLLLEFVQLKIEDLMPHLKLLQECYDSTYGAKHNESKTYHRIYSSAEDYYAGKPPISLGEGMRVDNPTDPVGAWLHPVTNFSTITEIKTNLEKYLTTDMVQKLFNEHDFLEFGGKLYRAFYGRGYGETKLQLSSAKITSLQGKSCTVQISVYKHGSYYAGTATVNFVKNGDKWYISSVSLPP